MRNINRVIMAGNMVRDPEVRQLPSDTPVASFSLAMNRRYRDRNGEPQEETTFVDCEAFGRTAEFLNAYGRKGRGLFVEGRLRQDRWQDKDGQNHSKMRVVVDNVQFTDSPGDLDHDSDTENNRAEHARKGPREGGNREPSRLTKSELEEILPF